MIELTAHPEGTLIAVHAQPGARRNAILGERAGALRVAVTAPPEKGKANAAIAAFLAECLRCKSSQVGLLSGASSRQKRFLIAGLTPEALRPLIAALLPAVGPTLPLS
jgi:uncharacterized protein (TIGR00251 family)